MWVLAAGLSAPPLLAAEFRQSVLQNGIYAFDKYDDPSICADVRKDCPGVATRFAKDPFWGRYFAAVCDEKNKGKCVCSADVVYPVLIGKDKSSVVNKAMKKIADGYACTAGMAITQLRYEVTFNTPEIFSVVFDGYGRGTGGQGSCHSQVLPMTANGKTGQVYKLSEVLNRDEEAAIRDGIVDYAATYFASRANADEVGRLKDQVRSILQERLWALGFYLRDRQLFVDLNDYILGCSEGPSFAIPIPSRYITNDEIRDALRLR